MCVVFLRLAQVAKVWPEYTGSPNAKANQEKSGVQLLRMVQPFRGQMRLQRGGPQLVELD